MYRNPSIIWMWITSSCLNWMLSGSFRQLEKSMVNWCVRSVWCEEWAVVAAWILTSEFWFLGWHLVCSIWINRRLTYKLNFFLWCPAEITERGLCRDYKRLNCVKILIIFLLRMSFYYQSFFIIRTVLPRHPRESNISVIDSNLGPCRHNWSLLLVLHLEWDNSISMGWKSLYFLNCCA